MDLNQATDFKFLDVVLVSLGVLFCFAAIFIAAYVYYGWHERKKK